MTQPDRSTLRAQLITHFSESELRDLCFDMELDYDNLPGEAKGDQGRELIAHCERHGQLEALLERLRAERPHVAWGSGSPSSQATPAVPPAAPGASGGTSYHATQSGAGAIAQGSGSTAVGAGGVNVGGSAGRSQIVKGNNNTVAKGNVQHGGVNFSNLSNSPINVGGSIVGGNMNVYGGRSEALTALFRELDAQIAQRPTDEQEELRPAVTALQAQVEKVQQGDESEVAQGVLARRLRTLRSMAGDIAEVALATLASPAAGISMVILKVAKRVQAEANEG